MKKTERIPTKRLIADTLEIMSILGRTEELADCLLWTGATGDTGHPIYKPYACPCTLVRRAMFRLAGGNLLPRKPIDSHCNERLCVNPAHLFQSTSSKIAIKAAKRGAFSSKARSAKIAAAKRAKGKLTLEQAREIRMSSESGPVLALRYGVNRSLINNIKAGRAWKDYANPFAGLMTNESNYKRRA